MNKIRKMLWLVLALLLVMSSAAAYTRTMHSGDFQYVLQEDGTAMITDVEITAWNKEMLAVPSVIDGRPVTAIGEEAFSLCIELTSITIPDSVTSIGDRAFTRFGSKLSSIIVSPEHPVFGVIDGVLFNKVEKELVYYPTTLTNTSYNVPRGIRSIGNSAFSGNLNLESITIPDTLTRIGDRAFESCIYLSSLNIPDSVTEVGTQLFLSVTRLSTLTISPDHPVIAVDQGVLIHKVEKEIMYHTDEFTASTYVIPDGIVRIGEMAFAWSDLESIVIPDSVTEIGEEAFSCCFDLTSVTLPANIRVISNGTFKSCSSLAGISIPNSVMTIGKNAFQGCDALTSVVIPESVVSIGSSAFNSCKSLTSVIIQPGTVSIERLAFGWCRDLNNVSIPASVTEIGNLAFDGCDKSATVRVERGSYAESWARQNGFTCEYIEDASVPVDSRAYGDLTYLVQQDGTITIIGCTTEETHLVIPAAIDGKPVTAIGERAFEKCRTLLNVTIPGSVISIADDAFGGCSALAATVERASYAAQWCDLNHILYSYPDSNDWLLD